MKTADIYDVKVVHEDSHGNWWNAMKDETALIGSGCSRFYVIMSLLCRNQPNHY